MTFLSEIHVANSIEMTTKAYSNGECRDSPIHRTLCAAPAPAFRREAQRRERVVNGLGKRCWTEGRRASRGTFWKCQ